jgi:hypothetical protein
MESIKVVVVAAASLIASGKRKSINSIQKMVQFSGPV